MKNKRNNNGLVYSTDPNFKGFDDEPEAEQQAVAAADQKIKIRLDKKHRGGKVVTLVEGFEGSDDESEQMVKSLKNFCGTGGSYKEGEILVQGDQRTKVLQWLQKNGYTKAKII